MLNKWLGSIDFGKLALNTSSGFIVTAAIIFTLDALIPGHLTENIFVDKSAGSIVVSGLIIIVGSSILGLMMDSIFHSFGRYFARKFWMPLRYEFIYRGYCMNDLGLLLRDFEWIYANSKDKFSSEVEKDYLRFTEVAGSAAYAMLLLLSPASFLFLRLEYHQSNLLSIVVAIFIAIGAFVLLLTSAESLSKYENKKTATAMDDIRKLGPFFHADMVKKDEKNEGGGKTAAVINDFRQLGSSSHADIAQKDEKNGKLLHWWSWRAQKNHWWSPRLLWLLVLIALAGTLLLASNIIANNKIIEEKHMTNIVLISELIKKAENVTEVPTIEIVVSKSLATPGDQAASIVIILNDRLTESTNIKLKDTNPVNLANLLNPLQWSLSVSLSDTTNVKEGDRIYINTLLSFNKPDSTERISAGEIGEGDWLFPIIVTDGNKDYLLAQVHVKIEAAPPKESETDESGGQTATATPVAEESSPGTQ